ncbi:ABC transporter permease [Paenibacillus agricola]|uniref:Sugar ABC transporter permease n=1 Tax=Paenibacillus agricola TaxID=2716264 RepID=A0ABX0JCN7_9BACL|nr:ABC transporter permease subunit [Paenibacillus agricola]NHN32518.1 sugar ABC transporter permease [Paenibacillus agricola]
MQNALQAAKLDVQVSEGRLKYAGKQIHKNLVLYAMFLLPALYFIIFHYIPMFGNLMAFEDYNAFKGFFGSKWVGTKHFEAFLWDPYFWKLVRNTLLLNVYSLIFYFPAPILFSLLLNELRHRLFQRFVQTITYIPHFLSTVVVVGIVVNLLSYDGLINQMLAFFGGEKISFLMKPDWFRFIYVSSEIWQGVGWGTIIYLAALAGVDPQLYEAATLDGAGRWRQIQHVTLPGIQPIITIMFLLTLGQILSVGFEKILLLYNGSTYETGDVIQTFIYRRGLLDSDFSFASAVGIVQSLLVFTLIVTANKISRKFSETSLW